MKLRIVKIDNEYQIEEHATQGYDTMEEAEMAIAVAESSWGKSGKPDELLIDQSKARMEALRKKYNRTTTKEYDLKR